MESLWVEGRAVREIFWVSVESRKGPICFDFV